MSRFRILLMAIVALAAGLAQGADVGRVPKPNVVIEQDGKCVADTATMRRDHMKLLAHQRDRTLREGIRGTQFSLNGCVDCHASRKTGSVLGADGFCQSCHAYAAVTLDCFQCHQAKRRAETKSAALLPATGVGKP